MIASTAAETERVELSVQDSDLDAGVRGLYLACPGRKIRLLLLDRLLSGEARAAAVAWGEALARTAALGDVLW